MSPLLEIRQLSVRFLRRSSLLRRAEEVQVVRDVSFSINEGETFGLAGESGCGKTTIAKTIAGLLRPTTGQVFLDGEALSEMHGQELRSRRKKLQMVFQDPFTSLNPHLSVGQLLSEALNAHNLAPGVERQPRINSILEAVGLSPLHGRRYPHELSGGQRQRVGIARALAVEPKLIICDEPVSALDASVQAQILNLLLDLQERFRMAYLFIAHDLGLVAQMSHRMAIMYQGQIVESGESREIVTMPKHAYSQRLLAAASVLY